MNNFHIDFSTIPNISDKLSSKEIQNLNDIFQNPEVIEKLKEIEVYRKKRQKAYWYVTLFMIVITLLVWYFIGKMAAAATAWFFAIIMIGIFFQVGSWDNSIWTIQWLWWLWAFLYGWVYIKYKSKIEIPLKRDIMSRICKNFHENFKYSYDSKYSFNDLDLLLKKKFLKFYNRLELVEDSVNLKVVKEGKGFILNGYELKTRKVSWSWKHKKNIVTNHDYVMKIVFPYARIPMQNDLLITPDAKKLTWRDKPDSLMFKIILFIIFGGIFLWLTWLLLLFNFENGITIGGVIMIWMIILLWILVVYCFSHRAKRNKITLEDIEFEKEFDVFCDDEITSRMILTPAFMDKLVSFIQKTGNAYSFLFTDNTVYIKRKIHKKYMEVGTKKNMFENVSGFLDFYLDMKEILILSRDIHFMYLSKTVDTNIEVFEVRENPIPFDNNPKWLLWILESRKKFKKAQQDLQKKQPTLAH